jgi:hypothetical protein
MGIFKARTAVDLATVSERLAEAESTLAALEKEFAERAVDYAVSDDASALENIQDRLRQARERCELLSIAQAEAHRREQKRLAAAKDAAEASRLAAIRSHTATMLKACKGFTENFNRVTSEYADMCRALNKVENLMTAQELRDQFGSSGAITFLKQLVALEMERVAAPIPGIRNPAPILPGIKPTVVNGLPQWQAVHALPPLVDRARERFTIATPRPASPPTPAPEPEPRPADAPREQGGGLRPVESPIKPGPELIGDYRGVHLDLPPPRPEDAIDDAPDPPAPLEAEAVEQ